MSQTEKKKTTVLDPSLLQSITQAFSQPIASTISSADQISVQSSSPLPPPPPPPITTVVDVPEKQGFSIEQTPLMILKKEFQVPTPTPRRSSNFLKGCKWYCKLI